MSKLFIVGILLFLLLAASGSQQTTQAARYIPWDCADWQAFAHADRDTAILESLAENRGKTLYCGIDQSDTFAKAETWAAGKDRNERDGTVYWGERGSFRGFIAAQEGWLTEGESGITGQSIATIFEFPKEKRRVKRTKILKIATTSPDDAAASCHNATPTPGDLLCSAEYTSTSTVIGSDTLAQELSQRHARSGYYGNQANLSGNNDWRTTPDPFGTDWQELAETVAASACRARGGKYVAGSARFGPGHDHNKQSSSGTWSQGDNLGWFYRNTLPASSGNIKYAARQSRTWTASCKKKIRRNR